jgi:hypothetical protein
MAEAGHALILETDLIPEKLKLRVYKHEIETSPDPLAVWTYLSVGLQNVGHPEVRMTFPCVESSEGAYREPVTLLENIYAFAEKGDLVGPMDQTWFDRDMLGFRRIVYIVATEFPGVNTPPNTLHAIFLKERESEELQTQGCPLRLLTRLGQYYFYYPWPPWSDPARPDLGATPDQPTSILAQAHRLLTPGCCIVKDTNAVALQLLPSNIPDLRKAIEAVPAGKFFVLMTGLDPAAHACMVWQPGQEHPTAISGSLDVPAGQTTVLDHANAKMAGCFAAFAPGIDWSGATALEDGYFVGLTDLDWRRVRQALENGEGITVESSRADHQNFAVHLLEEVYLNPIDGNEYHTAWSIHTPMDGVRNEHLPPGVSVSVRLLTREGDVQLRTTADELADLIKRGERTVLALLADTGSVGELTIQFDCDPDTHTIRLAHRGNFSDATLRMLHSQLGSLEPIRPKDVVSFQLNVKFD